MGARLGGRVGRLLKEMRSVVLNGASQERHFTCAACIKYLFSGAKKEVHEDTDTCNVTTNKKAGTKWSSSRSCSRHSCLSVPPHVLLHVPLYPGAYEGSA